MSPAFVYLICINIGGFLLGWLGAPLLRKRSSSQIVRGFYWSTALLLAIYFTINIGVIVWHANKITKTFSMVFGIAYPTLFAAIFGLAIRRREIVSLLGQPMVLNAIRAAVALTFAIAGIGKAFNMPYMTQFFIQSGYSVTFLHFIMLAEVMGAVGFLLPWGFVPALIGFTVDMFGAIVTHVHNGDPLDDSAGAIAMLLRLATIAVLLIVGRERWLSRFSIGTRALILLSGAVGCVVVAILGGTMLRVAK